MDNLNKRRLRDIQDTMTQTSQVDDSVREIADRMAKMKQMQQLPQQIPQQNQAAQVDPLGMMDRDKALKEIANTRQDMNDQGDADIKEKLESFGESALSEREQERLRNMPGLRQMLMGK